MFHPFSGSFAKKWKKLFEVDFYCKALEKLSPTDTTFALEAYHNAAFILHHKPYTSSILQ